MTLGAQFYTVKDYTKDLESFADSLKRVADIGYTTVQISGTCDFEADWLAEQLKATGLKCVLTHTKADKILADPKKVCDDHKIFGCRNIGLGMIPGGKGLTEEKYLKFVEDYKPALETINANGCGFFFHNHCEEFKRNAEGKTFMERMIEDLPGINFTLDTYWVQYAGCDVNVWLNKLKGKLECIHLKDMAISPEDWSHLMAPVGYGNMDFEKIIETAAGCDVKYLLVEQDKCYGENPFDCLKKSYGYLKALGLN